MGFRTSRFGMLAFALCSVLSTAANAQVNVTTYHNDNARTGQNIKETILTHANVNATDFGRLFTVTVDGEVYAQPLYLSNVSIAGATHNVTYVATQHDSVYAIDADTGRIYWQKNLIPAGGSSVSSSTDLFCGDIITEVGITGTPVIDAASGTLYVVAKVKFGGAISQHLHALDVSTGAEKFGGPNTITAQVAGTATDGDGSLVSFDARWENQRSALLLENGHVIVAWTAHCDRAPWHGWVMSYGATTLTLEGIYNGSANGYGNGIWMSGGGPAADTAGNIYFATGNGSWNATDQGDSVVKLGPPSGAKLPVLDYFTPYNQGSLASNDHDLSAGGLILLPALANGKQLLTIMGKEGKIYLLDETNLGKYCIAQTPACTNTNPQIVQEIGGALTGLWGVPAYWNGNLYWGGGNANTGAAEPLKAYSFNANASGKISTTATSVSAKTFNFSGPVPSISANGTTNAIVWAIDNGTARTTCAAGANCQALYAYDATNLGTLLYSSLTAANKRDLLGQPIKFVTPTIANGKVYVPSGGAVSAFGLLNAAAPAATAPTLTPGTGTYAAAQSVVLADATPNAVVYYTLDGSTPTTGSAKYTAALKVTATSTIKAFAAATGYTNSAVSTATYTLSTATTTPPATAAGSVSLIAAANVHAIGKNGAATINGGVDTYGFALSSTLLGTSVAWGAVTFELGAAGAADAVSNTTIALAAGNYTTLNLLATGVHGNQVGQKFVVTYTDGTTTTLTQSLSDWFTPQNYAGEAKAVTMAYRLTATGAQSAGPCYLYGYALAINSAKTVKSVTLPANRNVVVVSATLSGATTAPTTPVTPVTPTSGSTAISLAGVANVFAAFNDGAAPTTGGIDTHGAALSKTLLGASATWTGTTFAFGAAGVADAVSGVTVPLTAGSYSALKLLAVGLNGNQPSQTFTVTYTDGTTSVFTQSLSDWFTPQNYAGESKALTETYRLAASGAKDPRTFYVYGYSFALNAAKTVKSVTLPANRKVVVVSGVLVGTTATSAAATNVSLAAAATIYGISTDGAAVTHDGFDAHSAAYSAALLGTKVTWGTVPFTLLGPNVADAVTGATVTLPAGKFSTVNMLAASVNGSQAGQPFIVTYTDGTQTQITQGVSDWQIPASYPGESMAVTMAYRNGPTGAIQTGPFYAYGYAMGIDKTKTVASFKIPTNGHLRVLSLTLTP
jgi:hypothetical protein